MAPIVRNPLLAWYRLRRSLQHRPSAESSLEHLFTALHEAGHWLAYASLGVPIVRAFVDLRPKRYLGVITPTDPWGIVAPKDMNRVEFVAALAGPAVLFALHPYLGASYITQTSRDDIVQVREALAKADSDGLEAGRMFRTQWISFTETLIRDSWPKVEALAYELLCQRNLYITETERVEAKYDITGAGRRVLVSPAILVRLSVFHSSPAQLGHWLLCNA